jgi:murein DD-endopeptidase MepM/ murein hydrolase activator NlpD
MHTQPRTGILIAAGLLLAALAYLKWMGGQFFQPPLEEAVDSTALIPPPPKLLYGINIDTMEVERGLIRRNENLAVLLARYNVPQQTIAQLGSLPRDTFDVRRIQAHKPYTLIHNRDSLRTARAFVYHPNPVEYIVVDLADPVHVHSGRHAVDTIVETATGVIGYSLYNTILEQGGSPLLVNELADVFAWAVDFFGIQSGDAFKVIYERYEVEGQDAGLGPIHGAWFRHMGKEFYAVRYDQGEGPEYFDETGRSLRKTFLKAPLKFSRISSRFSYSRKHPILKIHRAHTGVDYAAPAGTPVVSVGDGTVLMAGYHGGGGNTVRIRHNSNWETAYLHLSRFAKGIGKGSKVKQGDLIGYVGSTGLSTGPHLDFRFYKNGQPVDPLKVDPPSAAPIAGEKMADYLPVMELMKARIDAIALPEGAPL